MAYQCSLCETGEAANVLITPLQGGETIAIGPDCYVSGLTGLLSVAAGVDAEQLYDALTALRDAAAAPAAAADAAKAASPPARPRAPRKGTPGKSPAAVPQSEPASA